MPSPANIFLWLAILLKFTAFLYCRMLVQEVRTEYTYLGDDHPRTWDVDTGGAVKMRFENSVHYTFDNGETGTRIWEAQFPRNGIINLGPHKQPFSIAMIHELRCLSHLRTEMILGRSQRENNVTFTPSRLSRHCLNYLRQMALCRADVDLEAISILPSDAHMYEYRCNDWTAVYDAIEKNQNENKGSPKGYVGHSK